MVAPTNNIPSIGMMPMEDESHYASRSYSPSYSVPAEFTNGSYIQPQLSQHNQQFQQINSQSPQCYYPQANNPSWKTEEMQQSGSQLIRASSTDLPQVYNNGNYYNPSPRSNIFPHRVPVFENFKNSGYPTAIWTFNTRLLVDCNKAFEDLIMDNVKLDSNSIVKFKGFLHSGKFSCFDLFPAYFLPYANECYTNLVSEIATPDQSIIPAENAHEMVFKRPDGGEISVMVTCTPVFGMNKQHPGCPQVTHYIMQIIRLQSMPARPKATAIRIEPYESPIRDLSPQQQHETTLDQFNNMALNENTVQYEPAGGQYYPEQLPPTPNDYITQQHLTPTNNGLYSAFEDPTEDYSSFLDTQTPNSQYYDNNQYFKT